MPINHTFVSGIAEGADPTKVGPNEWNASHAVTLGQRFLTASASINATDEYVEVTSGSPTLTLPDATSASVQGRVYYFLNSGTGTVTIATVSSQNINADTSYQMANQWQFVKLISNGTAWRVIAFGVAA